ncbi:MAG: hypothetical protein KAT61_03280 [Gammaproteobacteria bacterium]|nr:hypothetical protein [Gammaproteobacteria bacterium]
MIIGNQQAGKKQQHGLALLVLVIMLALTFTAYYFSSISVIEIQADNIQNSRKNLRHAKQALIGYALSNWRTANGAGKLGKLPCPDYKSTLEDGEQDGNCGNAYANGIGYLPWRTLGIDVPKDSSGSCLLYAVSPAYKTSPAAALNPESYGQLKTVDSAGNPQQGTIPDERLVAVIIAPGNVLPGQTRLNDPNIKCGSYYSNDIVDLVNAYMDDDGITDNTDIVSSPDNTIDEFVHKYSESETLATILNDRLITISYDEIWVPLLKDLERDNFFDTKMRNLTEALAKCLAEYATYNDTTKGKKSLPWPAALDLNEYRNSYSYDDNADDTKGHAGRLPYQVLNSNATIGNDLTEPSAPYAGFMEYSLCNNLNVGGTTIDLTDKDGEYWNLWSNWKEYFFYVLSKSYNPDNSGVDCAAGCIQLSVDRAGIVFFSGLKQTVGGVDQQRYSPPLDVAQALDGANDKDEVFNYLENNNAADFPDDAGILPAGDGGLAFEPGRTFEAVGGTSKDIMYCINTDLSVVECL